MEYQQEKYQIKELEKQIDEKKKRIPPHSVKPEMLQQLEELEEQLEKLKKNEKE